MPPMVRVIVSSQILADPDRLERVIENQLDMSAAGVRVDFRVTTKTWRKQPEFHIYKHARVRIVGTTDMIYRFLNSGTRVRRAMMSTGFRAKTVPGAIRSRVGRGGRVFISKKLALPGIVARDFSETIAEKWRKQFPVLLQRALDVELTRI